MRKKSIVMLLIITVILAACAGPTSTAPVVTENPFTPTPRASVPTPYPEAVVVTPLPTISAYPEPGSPSTGAPVIPPSGYEPQPGDESLKRDRALLELENSQIVESTGVLTQVKVSLQGNLSDPCHRLRVVVTPPDAQNTINLDVYSLVEPGLACITVLKPFIASIPLGSYTGGHYTVVVNGEKLGEFGSIYAPQPGDELLTRGEVFMDMTGSKLITTGTLPLQVSVLLKGDLPTPCHKLRVVITEPNEKEALNLEVYSLTDPDAICTTVLQHFEATIALGSYSSGHMLVYVNDAVLGEFGIGYEPQPGDDNMTRDEVSLDMENSQILTTGTEPIQVNVILRGSLSDPCHQLRVVVAEADENKALNLEVYSLVDSGIRCISVLKPFDATIQLGSFTSGHYSVNVNGELLGEFDL